jgi:hypothetical protein
MLGDVLFSVCTLVVSLGVATPLLALQLPGLDLGAYGFLIFLVLWSAATGVTLSRISGWSGISTAHVAAWTLAVLSCASAGFFVGPASFMLARLLGAQQWQATIWFVGTDLYYAPVGLVAAIAGGFCIRLLTKACSLYRLVSAIALLSVVQLFWCGAHHLHGAHPVGDAWRMWRYTLDNPDDCITPPPPSPKNAAKWFELFSEYSEIRKRLRHGIENDLFEDDFYLQPQYLLSIYSKPEWHGSHWVLLHWFLESLMSRWIWPALSVFAVLAFEASVLLQRSRSGTPAGTDPAVEPDATAGKEAS